MAKKDSERIIAIREKANQQRREQQRAEKRKTVLIQSGIALGIIVVVGAIVGGVLVAQNNRAPVVPPSADGTISLLGTSGVPFEVAETAVTVGQEDAPVQIDIYEDYSCPHCADYEAAVGSTVLQLIADGDAVVSYHPIQIVTSYGTYAGSAAACVAENDPQNWTGFHTTLFSNHSSTSDGWNSSQFADFAKLYGITDEATLECISDGTYTSWIGSNTDASRDAGVTGTPTLFINGEQQAQLLGPDELLAVVANAKGN